VWWSDVANNVLVASLIFGVVATFLIVKAGNVKEAHWDNDRRQSAERIAALSAQSDELRKETAEANARALEAQLELERFKAPRNLNPEQQQRIIDKLAQFAGTPFDLEVNPSPEPIEFLSQLAAILTSAGWKWLSRQDTGGTGVSSGLPGAPVAAISAAFVGLGIAIDISQEATWLAAVMALANALAAEGIKVQVQTKATMPTNAIHIVVGTKQ
jgi:hypothetical protein